MDSQKLFILQQFEGFLQVAIVFSKLHVPIAWGPTSAYWHMVSALFGPFEASNY